MKGSKQARTGTAAELTRLEMPKPLLVNSDVLCPAGTADYMSGGFVTEWIEVLYI